MSFQRIPGVGEVSAAFPNFVRGNGKKNEGDNLKYERRNRQ